MKETYYTGQTLGVVVKVKEEGKSEYADVTTMTFGFYHLDSNVWTAIASETGLGFTFQDGTGIYRFVHRLDPTHFTVEETVRLIAKWTLETDEGDRTDIVLQDFNLKLSGAT